MSPNFALDRVIKDLRDEREAHLKREVFTNERDDSYIDHSLALAAAAYAIESTGDQYELADSVWPESWDRSWLKSTTSRRDLIKAGALIIAEIERLDRAEVRRKLAEEARAKQPASIQADATDGDTISSTVTDVRWVTLPDGKRVLQKQVHTLHYGNGHTVSGVTNTWVDVKEVST